MWSDRWRLEKTACGVACGDGTAFNELCVTVATAVIHTFIIVENHDVGHSAY